VRRPCSSGAGYTTDTRWLCLKCSNSSMSMRSERGSESSSESCGVLVMRLVCVTACFSSCPLWCFQSCICLVCMYVKIRRHQHTRVHAHTGPRRHARAPAHMPPHLRIFLFFFTEAKQHTHRSMRPALGGHSPGAKPATFD